MTTSTNSQERVEVLIQHSTEIYNDIDQEHDGETRYRRMLRVGINAVATTLHHRGNIDDAGLFLISMPSTLLAKTGPLDSLADAYADVPRATLDMHEQPETDARHAIHLMKLATRYAQEHYPELNQAKVAVYALIHDIVEAYAGDTPSLGITEDQALKKHDLEMKALAQLRADYGEAWPEFIELIDTYELLADTEACFVKTFDKLDPSFSHFSNHGKQLKEVFHQTSKHEFYAAIDRNTRRMNAYAASFPQLMEDRLMLIQRVAEVSYP